MWSDNGSFYVKCLIPVKGDDKRGVGIYSDIKMSRYINLDKHTIYIV